MLNKLFEIKKEIDDINNYICKKEKDIEKRQKDLRKEMDKWGKRNTMTRNFP